MRAIRSILLSLVITLSTTGCVLVLGVHDFPGDSRVIVIEDEVYVVDEETKTLRRIDADDEAQIDDQIEPSDSNG